MFCPECGSKVQDDAKFCANCGKVINQSQTDNSNVVMVTMFGKNVPIPKAYAKYANKVWIVEIIAGLVGWWLNYMLFKFIVLHC